MGVRKQNIWVLNTEQWYNIGICDVRLDYLYHDVPNYCIHLEINNEKIIYATDTSQINHIKAKNYDFALIEANYYTDDELNEKILECDRAGKFTHLKRVKETHLSQLKALNWLQENEIRNYNFIHIHENKEE